MYVFTSSPRDRACTARSAAGSDRHQQRDKCLQNSFKAVVLLGVLSIATQPVRGADMSALSWDECVAEASANNSELLAARAGVEAAGHSHSKARGQLRPKLSAYGTYDRIDGDQTGRRRKECELIWTDPSRLTQAAFCFHFSGGQER